MSLNDVDFTGRMQAGRDLAARERHLGRASSRPRFAKRPPAEDTAENRLAAELAHLRGELRDRDNTIAVLQQGGSPDDFGAEFDRLFTAGKSEGQACRPAPRSPSRAPVAREDTRGRTMTTKQYLAALKKLGLTPSARATAEALGLTVRQCQKYAAGHVAIPETVAKLLAMYLEYGLPVDGS